jgi:anaerobic ribonucleoside-triphosphate reductase activating protein
MENEKSNIQMASLDVSGSICDGPGIRTVVYFQGCNRYCVGCQNPQTWDFKGGQSVSIPDLVKTIITGSRTQRVTISGGEPLEQKEALTTLVILLKEQNFDIALYTGYLEVDVPVDILMHIDFLKTGEYRQDLRTSTTAYVGSTNQIFRKLQPIKGVK